jgi:hypothetical protein
MTKIMIVGMVLLGVVAITQLPSPPTAKVTIHVQDEEGQSISSAAIDFAFLDAHPQWGSPIGIAVHALTDTAGNASGSGYSDGGIGMTVHKNGFYDGGPSEVKFHDIVLGKWQPWNPTYPVILKKIINPIPMYAKKVQVVVPAMDQPIGFDLAAGDWVKPFGTGATSDFVFTMSHTLTDTMNFSAKLVLTLSNKGDGLQVAPKSSGQDQGWSRLKFPRNAPEDGYTMENWTTAVSRTPTGYKEEPFNSMGYFLRVRTVKTDNGDIKNANYGKIDGGISIVGAATPHPGITFTYYFNPTGTTNLEFNPSQNLLKNLNNDEQVQVP